MATHRVLIEEGAIRRRVDEIARSVAGDLADRALVLVGLLTGSFVFAADLARALGRLGIDVRVCFLEVSHYANTTDRTRPVELVEDGSLDVAGRAVLLLDDIADSGASLAAARASLARRGPAWLRTCVLLDKPERHAVPFEPDYVGFVVPDLWLIGYGLDLGGEGRALPYVGAVDPSREDDD